jgi:hypothetical protein
VLSLIGLFVGLPVPLCFSLALVARQADTMGRSQNERQDRVAPLFAGDLRLVKDLDGRFVSAHLEQLASLAFTGLIFKRPSGICPSLLWKSEHTWLRVERRDHETSKRWNRLSVFSEKTGSDFSLCRVAVFSMARMGVVCHIGVQN